jgi:hypothetical protein
MNIPALSETFNSSAVGFKALNSREFPSDVNQFATSAGAGISR